MSLQAQKGTLLMSSFSILEKSLDSVTTRVTVEIDFSSVEAEFRENQMYAMRLAVFFFITKSLRKSITPVAIEGKLEEDYGISVQVTVS